MPKFEVEKLVRDKIVDGFSEDPRNSADFEKLDGDRKIKALIEKFGEEVTELALSGDKTSIRGELVDIQSLINATIKELDITPEEFDLMVEEKEKKVGGFDEGIYLKSVTFAKNYKWTPYFRKKYKEII